MPLPTTLKYKSSGDDTRLLQALLQHHGAYSGRLDGFFGSQTLSAVRYFQMTHLGPDKRPLKVDGIVGTATWWALHNASGPAQRYNLAGTIPEGLSDARAAALRIALGEHAAGVREIPDGSNWGDGVIKYLPGYPAPWCCFFVWWVMREATGAWLWGEQQGHVASAWSSARDSDAAFLKGKYAPVPGDMFVMLYRNSHGNLTGKGHIGFVLGVSADGNQFTTVEGNAGNRVKMGLRSMGEDTLIGFINPFNDVDQPQQFTRGIDASAEALASSLASTR